MSHSSVRKTINTGMSISSSFKFVVSFTRKKNNGLQETRFAICYVLVDNGVDVAGLLSKIGINRDAGEKAGTFALAYAAHSDSISTDRVIVPSRCQADWKRTQ